MAYRKPFTKEQRRDAVRAFRSYKENFNLIRRKYRPATDQQSSVLAEYRTTILEVASELEKADDAVDIVAMNRLDTAAKWLAVEYQRLRIVES